MSEHDWLAERFEENRPHLRAVAYRMLGSASRGGRRGAGNLAAAQPCGHRRGGEPGRLAHHDRGAGIAEHAALADAATRGADGRAGHRATGREPPNGTDPEHEAVLADSVGLALLVVLDTLTPAERLAFVLHDMFAVPFEEIAPIVERSPVATRQLASRARRRVQEAGPGDPPGEISRRREVVAAFLAASREGDFDALLTMLDPDIVLRADNAAAQMGADAEATGARAVAGFFSGRAEALRPALIDGAPGAVWTLSRRDPGRVRLHVHRRHDHRDRADRRPGAHRPARGDPPQSRAETRQAQRGQLAGSSGIALARTTLA